MGIRVYDISKKYGVENAVIIEKLHALGYKQIQELVITIGYYMMVSRFLETFDVDIEAKGEEPADDQMPGVKKA